MAEPTEKKSFDDFLAAVPDAPSSAAPSHEEPAADAAPPKGEAPAEPDAPAPDSSKTDAKTPSAGAPADLEGVRAALAAGDLDALSDLLGEDPALYSEKTVKWAARKRKEEKLRAERDQTVAKAERVVERWAPVANATEAITTRGEYAQVFDLVEALTGEPADQVWAKALRARGPADPRVPALAKRAEEAEARAAAAESERRKRADAAFFETLRDELDADHQVRQIDGWEAKVAEVLRDSVDPDLGEPKLSTKQAAARVLRREREEFERRAKVFGGADAAPRAAKPKAPERAAGASGAKTRKLTREEWLAARGNS